MLQSAEDGGGGGEGKGEEKGDSDEAAFTKRFEIGRAHV